MPGADDVTGLILARADARMTFDEIKTACAAIDAELVALDAEDRSAAAARRDRLERRADAMVRQGFWCAVVLLRAATRTEYYRDVQALLGTSTPLGAAAKAGDLIAFSIAWEPFFHARRGVMDELVEGPLRLSDVEKALRTYVSVTPPSNEGPSVRVGRRIARVGRVDADAVVARALELRARRIENWAARRERLEAAQRAEQQQQQLQQQQQQQQDQQQQQEEERQEQRQVQEERQEHEQRQQQQRAGEPGALEDGGPTAAPLSSEGAPGALRVPPPPPARPASPPRAHVEPPARAARPPSLAEDVGEAPRARAGATTAALPALSCSPPPSRRQGVAAAGEAGPAYVAGPIAVDRPAPATVAPFAVGDVPDDDVTTGGGSGALFDVGGAWGATADGPAAAAATDEPAAIDGSADRRACAAEPAPSPPRGRRRPRSASAERGGLSFLSLIPGAYRLLNLRGPPAVGRDAATAPDNGEAAAAAAARACAGAVAAAAASDGAGPSSTDRPRSPPGAAVAASDGPAVQTTATTSAAAAPRTPSAAAPPLVPLASPPTDAAAHDDGYNWRQANVAARDLAWIVARASPLVLARGGTRAFGARVTPGGGEGGEQGEEEGEEEGEGATRASRGLGLAAPGGDAAAVARLFCAAGALMRRLEGALACPDANAAASDACPDMLMLGLGPWFTSALRIVRGGAEEEEEEEDGEAAGSAARDAATDGAVFILWLDPALCRGNAAAAGRGRAPVFQLHTGSRSAPVRHGSAAVFPASSSARRVRLLAGARVEASGNGDDGDRLVELRFYASELVRGECSRLGAREVYRAMAASLERS